MEVIEGMDKNDAFDDRAGIIEDFGGFDVDLKFGTGDVGIPHTNIIGKNICGLGWEMI